MTEKVSLTIERVKAAGPKAKRYVIWSKDVKGFGLRITPDGSKSYVVKYLLNGRQRWLTIGSVDAFTPKQAEDAATAARGELTKDKDPATEKKAKRHRGATVRDLCTVYTKALDVGQVLTKSGRPKSEATITSDKSRINAQILPLLGNRRVRELTNDDVEKFLHDIADGKARRDVKLDKKRARSIVKGGQGAATRTVGLLGGIIAWGMRQKPPYCETNPVRGVQRFSDRKMERFLSVKEMQRLGAALTKLEGDGRDPYAIAAIRFLMLSGCRKGEVLTLQWGHVDFEHSCLRLPKSKTGAKVVPIGAPALSLLKRLPRMERNPFVFAGAGEGAHRVELRKVFGQALKAAKLPPMRIHDLRHSFASMGLAGGLTLPVIGAMLGHSDPRTTKRYAHAGDDLLRDAADRVARTIDAGLKGKKSATIHRLPAAKAAR